MEGSCTSFPQRARSLPAVSSREISSALSWLSPSETVFCGFSPTQAVNNWTQLSIKTITAAITGTNDVFSINNSSSQTAGYDEVFSAVKVSVFRLVHHFNI